MSLFREKPDLGERYTCYSCGTKFYDLNRPAALCPECGTDQIDAPVSELVLSSGKRRRRKEPEPLPEPETTEEDDEELLDSDDDEDDDLLGADE